MRNFINLCNTRQSELTKQFPSLLTLVCVEETTEYGYVAVSVFDHWLSQEEAVELLDNVSKDEQTRRNRLLYCFSKKLASTTEVINVKFRGKGIKSYPLFRGFTSETLSLGI